MVIKEKLSFGVSALKRLHFERMCITLRSLYIWGLMLINFLLFVTEMTLIDDHDQETLIGSPNLLIS